MAGSLRPDEIQLRVLIDGSPARKELVDLSQLTAKLRAEQKALIDQQSKLRSDKSEAARRGDAAAVKALAEEERKLRDARGANTTALVEAEKKAASMRQEIGLDALSLRELRNELRAAKSAYDAATPNTEQWVAARTRLDQVNTAFNRLNKTADIQAQVWERIRGQYKLTDMTIEQLEMEVQRLNALIKTTNPNDASWKQLNNQLHTTDKRLSVLRSGLGPFGRLWAEVKSQVVGAGAVLAGMFAASGIVSGFQGLVRSAKEFSDQLADVRKTTNLSTSTVRALAGELNKLDTRTSRQELLALARDAGKLGISAKEDVLAFVKAGNQINVALGEDLGEDAIKNIGKLVDLFKLKDQFGLEGAMLKVGSAINVLGMSSTASEGYMVDFLKRMGGIAPLAGITVQQTLALGATLDQLGQTSKVSSTALSKLFVKLGADSEKYARIANMSAGAFKELLQKNALEAFIAVLEGSRKTEGGLVSLTETLGDMGIDAARAAGVFGVLSNNTDVLREQMGLANKAFAEGSSITDEYNIRNENLAANIEKLGKEFNRLFTNTTVLGWMDGLVAAARNSVQWLIRNKDAVITFLKILGTAAGTWITYRVAVAATTRVEQLAIGITRAYGTVLALVRGQITAATVATRAFNTAVKLNPIGLLLSGITAAVGLLGSFGSAMEEVSAGVAKETTALQNLYYQIITTNQGSETRKKLLEQLKALYPDYLKDLDTDKTTNEELGRAVKFVNEQLINKAVLAKADIALEDQNARSAEAKLALIEKEIKIREQLGRISEEDDFELPPVDDLLVMVQTLQKTPGIYSKLGEDHELFLRNLDQAIIKLRAEYNVEQKESNLLAEARVKLMRALGIEVTETADAQTALANSTGEANATSADQVRNVKFLNEAIKSLQEQQENAADPATYKRLQAQIDALEQERDRITGARQSTTERKQQDHLDELLKQYQEFQARLGLETEDADTRALRELDLKHAEELLKVREQQAKLIAAKKLTPEQAATDTGQLQSGQQQERAELIEAQGERRMEAFRTANERITALLRGEQDARLASELEAVEEQLAIAQQEGRDTIALEERKRDLLLQIYTRNAEDAIAAEQEKWQQVIDEARKSLAEYERLAGRDGEIDDGEAAKIQEYNNTILTAEQALSDAKERINLERIRKGDEARRRETLAERQEYGRRIQNVAEWANALGSIMSGALQIRDAEIDVAEQRADADGKRTQEEIANLDRLQAARRRAALTHLAVQAAAAVASAVASALASTIPFPGNLLAAAPAVATVLGLIAQARGILAQGDLGSDGTAPNQGGGLQNVPLGERGIGVHGEKIMAAGGSSIPSKKQQNPGIIASDNGGGVLGGSLHSEGGNTLYDNRTGRPLAEVERDELMLVMSRKATEANADLIPLLLHASRNGLRLPIMDRPVAVPNMQKVQQAMGVAYMAQGGARYSSVRFTRGSGLAPEDDGTLPGAREATGEMLNVMKRVAQATERITTLKVSLLDEERRRTEYDRIKALNKGARAA